LSVMVEIVCLDTSAPYTSARCALSRVGPQRGSGVATGPFLRTARRTRRAPFNATGSPRFCRQPWFVLGHGVGILPRRRYLVTAVDAMLCSSIPSAAMVRHPVGVRSQR
jgi:hypothetical protein